MAAEPAPRRYDNSSRLEQAAATRDRVVAAGAELLREHSVRDWGNLTIRAVAERAGVSERTVYRHFGTEKGLRDAIMASNEERAGIDLGSVDIDELAEVAAKVLRAASDYPRTPEPPLDATLHEADARRQAGLVRAVQERTPSWTEQEQLRAAALIDLIWSMNSYERLLSGWQMDRDTAIDVVTWGLDLVVAEATTSGSPAAPRARANGRGSRR